MVNKIHFLFQWSFLIVAFVVLMPFQSYGQQERVSLDISDYDLWKRIENERISNDGTLIGFREVPGKGDATFKLVSSTGAELLSYDRVQEFSISADSRYAAMIINPHRDSLRALERIGTKEKDLPKDTLGIYNVASGVLQKVSPVRSFEMPEEWSGYLLYTMGEVEPVEDTTKINQPDSLDTEKPKKVGKDNGYHLVVRNLESGIEDTIHYVTTYILSKSAPAVLIETSGKDSLQGPGIYRYDPVLAIAKVLMSGDFEYKKLAMSEDGKQAAFLVDRGDPKAYVPGFELRYWDGSMDSTKLASDGSSVSPEWIISQFGEVEFSEDGRRLFFGTSPPPLIKDTTLLEDEIIQVEVWSHHDQRLQPQQEVQKKRDEEKSYLAVYYPVSGQQFQLEVEEMADLFFGDDPERNSPYALGTDRANYLKQTSWEGNPPRQDMYLVNLEDGSRQLIAAAVRARGDASPAGRYLVWYNVVDTAYYAYDIATQELTNISSYIGTSIVDELDDHPDFPPAYGLAGWTVNDEFVLVYDRYDIWKVNPKKPEEPLRITKGREDRNRYRIEKLDDDRHHIDFEQDLLSVFNEVTRDESIARLSENTGIEVLLTGSYRVGDLQNAKDSDELIYSIQNHVTFPDLHFTGTDFSSSERLSHANPQQAERKWSSVEIISWNSLDGEKLEGLLYRPADFDPSVQYPLIVYFYERNADNVHRYWGAYPHRSIINPSYYASRGYVIFIPDIVYRDGYPGPSCYNAVIPGITHLLDQGYIDRERIGVQGHSWGGYQAAHLVTRTNLFACAEAGAPVANMTSAYGGIRWGPGMSRMFQYERTQSRIGGTLWEYPLRYMENSPIFFADKINTPMMLMHNDHDTAVPWYQGIELFVALRRLDKPVWMLNYNGEPHWPTKRENIVDFNTRMQQFFDHYLMGQPMPSWMEEGIPAVFKGYRKGY